MTTFNVHTRQTAPAAAVPVLDTAEKTFGFVPNLVGVLSESPAAAEAYLTLMKLFDKSSLTPVERQVAILAISRANECHYCMAAHSAVAETHGVPDEVIAALRNDQPINDPKLEALRVFARKIVERRGWVSDQDIAAFLAAGFDKAQILEVILAVSLKTLSTYANHVADTPLDAVFKTKVWPPTDKAA